MRIGQTAITRVTIFVSTKSHHYLPQVYLRRFTARENRKLLWECDKTTGIVKASTPKMSGCEDFFHAFKKQDGSLDTDSIEQDLSRIETDIDGVYEALRMKRQLTQAEWTAFFAFAGSMSVRVPAFINTVHEFTSKVMRQSFEIAKYSPAILKCCADNRIPGEVLANVHATADRDFSLLLSLQAMYTPIELFSQMRWQFIQASAADYFVTGDNPVFRCAPTRQPKTIFPPGLAHKDIEVTFPLSKSVCAFGTWDGQGQLYRAAGTEIVNAINTRTTAAARKYLYGPTKNATVFTSWPKQKATAA